MKKGEQSRRDKEHRLQRPLRLVWYCDVEAPRDVGIRRRTQQHAATTGIGIEILCWQIDTCQLHGEQPHLFDQLADLEAQCKALLGDLINDSKHPALGK